MMVCVWVVLGVGWLASGWVGWGWGGMGWGNGEGRRDEMEYVCGSLVEQCCWQVVNCIRDADVLACASGMAGCLVFVLSSTLTVLRTLSWMQCQLF